MKVTEDLFYRGLIHDGVFAGPTVMHMASRIHAGLGTKCEPVRYTREERLWASKVRGKPFDHKSGYEFDN